MPTLCTWCNNHKALTLTIYNTQKSMQLYCMACSSKYVSILFQTHSLWRILYFFLCVSRQLHEGLGGYGGFEKALDREIWFDMLCWDGRALFISLCYKMCFSSERAHAETSTDGIINKELSHLILCMLYLFVKSAYCVAFFKPRFSSSIFSNLKSSSLISHSSLLTAIMKVSV